MEPIFNFLGQTVGWLEDGIAFSNDGQPVAFIQEGFVFVARNGHYLGHFHKGVFRDRLGCIVAFIRGTRWFTTLTTVPDARPAPSVQSRAVLGRTRRPEDTPCLAEPLLNKSSLDWERFVMRCEAHWPWETHR